MVRDRLTKLEAEMRALTTRVEGLESTSALAASNTQEILDFLKSARTVSGVVRKHGPRVVAFAIGALVMTGKISAETGRSFLHLLGL